MRTPQNYCHQCLCPHSKSQLYPSLARDPLIPAGSYEVTAFPPGSCCAQDSVCPLRVELLFSPGLQSNLADLQSQMFWGLLLPLTDLQAGEPDVKLRAFIPVAEPPQYNCFPICGFPTQQVLDLILSQPHPSYCLVMGSSLSLDLWYLFW